MFKTYDCCFLKKEKLTSQTTDHNALVSIAFAWAFLGLFVWKNFLFDKQKTTTAATKVHIALSCTNAKLITSQMGALNSGLCAHSAKTSVSTADPLN